VEDVEGKDMIRNIIWDVDGTLFDTYPPIARAFKSAIRDLGQDAAIEWIEELARISLGHCVSEIALACELEKEGIKREFRRYYAEMSAEESPPFSGVVEICDYIRSMNGKNVIVTHRGREGTVALLSTHGMIDKFADCIVRDDGYPRKPDPAVFIAALERNNLEREETINVGDREIDIVAGQSAGIFSCLYGSESGSVRPDLVVDDFDDLYQFILDRNQGRER
jgi:phosphoglycolate phosphatase-like HAD superfamily hydrolase